MKLKPCKVTRFGQGVLEKTEQGGTRCSVYI